jgi:hypothetical protein
MDTRQQLRGADVRRILKGLGKSVTDTRIKSRSWRSARGPGFAKERTRIVTALRRRGRTRTELRLQLSELHDRYKSQQAEAMADLKSCCPGERPRPQRRARSATAMKALNDIAEK